MRPESLVLIFLFISGEFDFTAVGDNTEQKCELNQIVFTNLEDALQ